jgi:hypothetical protein
MTMQRPAGIISNSSGLLHRNTTASMQTLACRGDALFLLGFGKQLLCLDTLLPVNLLDSIACLCVLCCTEPLVAVQRRHC